MRFDKTHNRISPHKKRSIRIRTGYSETHLPTPLPPSYTAIKYNSLHNTINSFRDEIASNAKRKQASSNAPEPGQIALVLLARHPDVHAPHTSDNVHGQDDGTEDGELAEDVGGLLGALVHTDVDLGKVVTVGTREEAVRVELAFCSSGF
jgi:hypothetical protein